MASVSNSSLNVIPSPTLQSVSKQLLPFGKIIFKTGNIMKAGGLRLTGMMASSQTELLSFLDDLLRRSLYHKSFTVFTTPQLAAELVVTDPKYTESSGTVGEEREECNISVKLFCLDPSPRQGSFVTEAVSAVLNHLNISYIDSFVVSDPEVGMLGLSDDIESDMDEPGFQTPSQLDGLDGNAFDTFLNIYEELEKMKVNGKVHELGVSGFNREELEKLCGKVKNPPSINEITLHSCCVVPRDLIAFTKPRNIQLLTHNDVKNILPPQEFQAMLMKYGIKAFSGNNTEEDMSSSCQDLFQTGLKPKWTVRYSVVVKNRGVVVNKGYIVSADVF